MQSGQSSGRSARTIAAERWLASAPASSSSASSNASTASTTKLSPLSSATPPTSADDLLVGVRLGRYELLAPIAKGGMAQVWAADQIGDLGFRKLVALKVIRPELASKPAVRAMFLDEASLASRIHHPNVVEVLDLGMEGTILFQAMTFVEGASLSAWAKSTKRRGPCPIDVALRIVIDMLHGLHAAHELCDDEGASLGLVHRDVSPHNILVGADGLTKLADFGIAKAFGRTADETSPGHVKGKISYLAPELLVGAFASRESDLFSAGVVLWELLTGARFWRSGIGLSERGLRRDPRYVAGDDENVPVPEALAEITMRALEDDPSRRFQTALEMATALEEAVDVLRLEDVSHRRVAEYLDGVLGPRIRRTQETLRSARRGNEGRNGDQSDDDESGGGTGSRRILRIATSTTPSQPPQSPQSESTTLAPTRHDLTQRRRTELGEPRRTRADSVLLLINFVIVFILAVALAFALYRR